MFTNCHAAQLFYNRVKAFATRFVASFVRSIHAIDSVSIFIFVPSLILLPCFLAFGQKPLLVTISKETTRIVRPLKSDGYPDYLAALNQQLGRGVTAENNIAVTVWETVGPEDLSAGIKSLYFKHLGMDPLPTDGNYYRSFYQRIEKLISIREADPDITRSEIQTRREAFDDQYEFCMRNPWNKDSSREMDLWLTAAEPFLNRIIQSTERRDHFYNPTLSRRKIATSRPRKL